MSKTTNQIYRARYTLDIEVIHDPQFAFSIGRPAPTVRFDLGLISSERKSMDQVTNEKFNYVEEHYIDAAKVLYKNMICSEAIVHTENRGNVRRHVRKVVLDLLKKSDDSARRVRLPPSPAKGLRLPDDITEWKKYVFREEVLEQMRELSANGVALTRKNLGIKRYVERLRDKLKTKSIRNDRERKHAEELVENYDTYPTSGDLVENPWKMFNDELKKYGITFHELKAALLNPNRS